MGLFFGGFFFFGQLWKETLNYPDTWRKGSNLREAGLHLHSAKIAFALVWDPSPSYPSFIPSQCVLYFCHPLFAI